jgi:hypothetical protein
MKLPTPMDVYGAILSVVRHRERFWAIEVTACLRRRGFDFEDCPAIDTALSGLVEKGWLAFDGDFYVTESAACHN